MIVETATCETAHASIKGAGSRHSPLRGAVGKSQRCQRRSNNTGIRYALDTLKLGADPVKDQDDEEDVRNKLAGICQGRYGLKNNFKR